MTRQSLSWLVLGLVTALPGTADTAPPGAVSPLADVRHGQPMRLNYELRASAWAFIFPITGKAAFDVEMHPETYRITSHVKTTGLADLIVNYNMNLSSTGYLSAERLRTYAYVAQNRDGDDNRRVELLYGETDVEAEVTPEFGNLGDPPAAPHQKLAADDPVTAFVGAGLRPRNLETDPCGGPIRSFDGRQLVHLHLTYAGRTHVRSRAWEGEAIECHVGLERVAGFDEEDYEKESLADLNGPLRMWLAPLPNGATMPVRIEADTDEIGRVVLQASKLDFEPIRAAQHADNTPDKD